MTAPLATHDYTPGALEALYTFLKRTRAELRMLRKVRLWRDKLHIIDINKDYFEVRNLGYADPEVAAALRLVNTAFNPATLHLPTDLDYKEFDTGRRHPWAEDRVM